MKYKLKGNIDIDILKQVCETRGVNIDGLQEFLNPRENVVSNPLIYNNMDSAAKTLLSAIKENLRIGLLIDSDCDGYLSSAMVVNYLKDVFGFEGIRFYIHQNKEHGLTPHIMNQIKEYPPQLLIIPDASSSDYEQHRELYELGVDILIIDHHEAEGYSPFAKVVNNQLQEGVNKTLSAGGMVLKFLEAIDSIIGEDRSKDYYDLASIALVGDCMLMNNIETRYYVQQGLLNIRNPLIEELIRAEGGRSYELISFDIAPTINAFIRVGSLEERRDLFLSLIGRDDLREITIRGQGTFELPLPEYVARMGSRVKSRQTSEVNKALNSENTKFIHNLPFTICILESSVVKSLTGLIGNRLTEMFKKPAIVLREINENFYAGSGRTVDTFPNFKDYLNETNLFVFCQGHQGAFGTKIGKDMLEILKQDYEGQSLDDDWDAYLVDKAYYDNVSAFDIMTIGELDKYWSRGFDKPLFYIKLTNLKDSEIEIIGQKRNTIRIKRNNITYLKFKCKPEEIDGVNNMSIKEVEMVGSFSINEYYNNLYPQIIIDDIEVRGVEKLNSESMFNYGFSDICVPNIEW